LGIAKLAVFTDSPDSRQIPHDPDAVPRQRLGGLTQDTWSLASVLAIP
jgi:hypothetical protein